MVSVAVLPMIESTVKKIGLYEGERRKQVFFKVNCMGHIAVYNKELDI